MKDQRRDAFGVRKRKLLLLAGAGSAIDFGLPSVAGVDSFFSKCAAEGFSLTRNPDDNLYTFLHQRIAEYWAENEGPNFRTQPHFEDVLYAISVLIGAIPTTSFSGVIGPFFAPCRFPKVNHALHKEVDVNVLSHLGTHLVDSLLDDFRQRCRGFDADDSKLASLQGLVAALAEQFDLAVVTTNYDDLLWRCMPGIETGFDPANEGHFDPGRIFHRKNWPCLLHLHGSVHFDMDEFAGDLHAIKWRNDLAGPFQQNSFGRNLLGTTEGHQHPTSSIVAGYGKAEQIQRRPFRTYYSEFDRLVFESDAVLSLGFSFLDAHVRQAFSNYRDGRDRPVVAIELADDGVLTAGSAWNAGSPTATRAMRMFVRGRQPSLSLGYSIPMPVEKLKTEREFERFVNSGDRLSIWYGGMRDACLNADKVIRELCPIGSLPP